MRRTGIVVFSLTASILAGFTLAGAAQPPQDVSAAASDVAGEPSAASAASVAPSLPSPPMQPLMAGCGAYAGEIRMWAGPPETAPTGWFICDGAAVDKDAAPELFAAIGTSWGGDGVPFFRLPDMRGRFPRGVDTGSSQDPERFSRFSIYTGGNTGATVGTYQLDATARPNSGWATTNDTHSHEMMGAGRTGNSQGTGNYLQGTVNSQAYGSKHTDTDTHNHGITGGDPESRPTNAYVHFIIFGGCDLVTAECLGDVDGDRDVDLTDLAIVLSVFGDDCDPNSP